jgi:hypothetical protein
VTFVYPIDDRDFGNNGCELGGGGCRGRADQSADAAKGNNGCALARGVIGSNGLETFPDLFRNNGCPGDGSLTHNR